MDEEEARRYGQYARHLFELSRDGQEDAVMLFLDSMDDKQVKDLLRLMIMMGGML